MFKLTIATSKRHSGVFIVNFEHISHTPFSIVSIVDTEQVNFSSVYTYWSLYSLRRLVNMLVSTNTNLI